MKFRQFISAAGIVFCLGGFNFANAATYYFSQSGYSGGGSISGTFVAEDLNGDGAIEYFIGSALPEVTDFHLSFSGDTSVGSFTHSYADLYGLVYSLSGGNYIGDGPGASTTEGIASNWNAAAGFDFASGIGPVGSSGGRVIDLLSGATSTTTQLVTVSAVPEPESWLMMSLGLVLVGRLANRRKS